MSSNIPSVHLRIAAAIALLLALACCSHRQKEVSVTIDASGKMTAMGQVSSPAELMVSIIKERVRLRECPFVSMDAAANLPWSVQHEAMFACVAAGVVRIETVVRDGPTTGRMRIGFPYPDEQRHDSITVLLTADFSAGCNVAKDFGAPRERLDWTTFTARLSDAVKGQGFQVGQERVASTNSFKIFFQVEDAVTIAQFDAFARAVISAMPKNPFAEYLCTMPAKEP